MPGVNFKFGSIKNGLHSLKIFIVISIMTFAGILSTTKSTAQATNVQDSLALIDIYNSTNGPGWTNKTGWTTGPVVTWYGVTLLNGRVDDLNLDGDNLVGTLPASIGNLTAIEYMELGDNKISGTIPTTVGNLSILRSLVWGNNLFTGTIPASLGSIPTLSDIYLGHNQLTGTIPSAIGNATNMANIDLSYNQLTGSIPASFNNLTNLFQLILGHNQLTGTIPSNLGNFLNINNIDLSVNQLTGPIPANMTNLTTVFTLLLDSNKFDFTGMGELATAVPVTVYAPQDTLLPIHLFMNGLAVSAGGKLIQEYFTWYDNGVVDKTVQNDSTYVPTNPASCGPFTVQVGNAACQNLTLYSQPYSVKVVDSISISASATDICVGTSVTFRATSLKQSKMSTFQWQVNGVNVGVSSLSMQYITSTLANNDVVTCVMTSGQHCANPLTYKSNPITMTVRQHIIPSFTQIGPLCQYSNPPAFPLISNEEITGTWHPATINTSTSGTSGYLFVPTDSTCYRYDTMNITILPQVIPTFNAIGPYCQNSAPVALPTTSKEGIPGTWNPATINTTTAGRSNYIFTPAAGQCAKIDTIPIVINPLVTPTFDAIGPLCQNSAAPALPATSKEGIAGTWNPAVINTATVGTSNYIFTPTAVGTCNAPATLSITISTRVVPTFDAIGPFCQNAIAPALPATSKEGIAGSWDPAVISTTTVGTFNYIFTPAAGQCAKSDTIQVVISTQVTPTFNPIGPLCQNSAAPALPATSKEGIAGTWNPAVISTTTVGTSNYIFTPTAGGACNTPATLSITISTQVVPTFDAIGPLCQNATAPGLPATSKEGIAGTWNPAVISTTTLGASNYIFTPTAGGTCNAPATLSITISTQVTPTFDAIGPLCQNATAPALPATSKEGIAGTWNPAVISTTTLGASNYIFTPTAGGTCKAPATLSITISTQVTPTFDAIGPLCQNATAPALPATSKEEIAGTWNPAVISTATIGTANYIFTPTVGGACNAPATLSITISTKVVPTFDAIGPLCQNITPPILPATSKQGIAGTWNPAVINTATLGTDNYIFTPTTGGDCSDPATLSITISTQVTPTFTAVGPLCQNATAPALPATSKEGIAGSWSPATVNTSVMGSNDYVFTPSGNQCATTGKLTIVVSPLPVVNAGPAKTINTGGTVSLTPVITGVTEGDISSYLWSPSDGLSNPAIASPVASPSVTTTYKLDVNSKAGCDGSGSVTVNVIKTNLPPIHIPNAFSPNGDGINDTWVIENISYYPGATLDLFNRYGQLLLHSEGYGKAWDGTYNGNPVPVATYYYVLDPKNNLPKMTGSVTVFR
jgi:gliding motility-associated-like protein